MSRDGRIARLNEAFLYVDDIFLELVEQERKTGYRKHKKRIMAFWSTVAACFCMMIVLPAVAMTYNWFGLKDILLPEDMREPENIALLKYQETPEIQALEEWKEFLAGYDMDQIIQSETANGELTAVTRKDWILYGVCSLEMGEKLDEIAGRYRLELHTERKEMNYETLETMSVGKFIEGSTIEEGCIFEDGSFQYEGSIELGGGKKVEFQVDYAVKGTFCETMPIIGEANKITEWQYTSACGEPVLLVLGTSETLIFADFEKCFVAIAVQNENGNSITQAVLQELADRIDFHLLKDAHASESDGSSDYVNGDKVTLSGYQLSPEAKASAEWEDFLSGYDIEAAIGTGNSVFIAAGRDDWSLYAVYSNEMGEKLDEIASKYGLKLWSEINVISPEEMEYRVGGNFMKDCTKYWGYIYEDGTLGFEGDVDLDGCGKADFQFNRAVKGTFGDVILSIGQVEDYAEWQYLSACGEPVLLALGPYKALIFADFEKCFISVNILSGSETGMTEEDLQGLADKIDFKILKDVKVPDMRGDSGIQ